MKKVRRITAVFLAVILLSVSLVPVASAQSEVDPSEGTMQKIEAKFYMLVDKLIYVVGRVLNTFIPGLDWGKRWQNYDDYETPDEFYGGESDFHKQVQPDATWSMGYAYASLLEGIDVLNGEYYMAGALEAVKGRVPTEILDDQGVSVYAVSDGVSGIAVQAVIDGFGIARADVLKIRENLSDFAKENDIISLNVSVLHQHSAIDTLGMGVPLLPGLMLNPGMIIMGVNKSEFISGKNQKFMENLYEVVTQSVINAVNDMSEGVLYYGSADASELMYDKREPVGFDGEIHRFRFDPYNADKDEIWVCDAGIHCTGLGGSGTELSADFPYYFKEHIKNTVGADVVYVQGAELAITAERENLEYEETARNSEIKAYGIELAEKVLEIKNETALDPVMNVKFNEVTIEPDNQILILAVRLGIVDSVVTKKGTGYALITEIGYMELGNKVGIAFVPGEIAPEILWGGAVSEELSWTNQNWNYEPLQQTAGVDTLICVGLNNDQIGYILTDNDIRSMLTENEEVNVCSDDTGSVITQAFEKLIQSVK